MGLMVYGKSLKKRRRMLEMAPMVDVVFQLLIFFLVATEFRPAEADFRTNLPGSGRGDLDVHQVFLKRTDDGTTVAVTLDRVRLLGTMHAEVDEDRLTGDAFAVLSDTLREARARSDGNVTVVIDGSPDVGVKFVAGAVDAAVEAGVARIVFGRPD